MKVFSLFLLLYKLLFAQYNSTMYDLIKTTYQRSFDKKIISKYLNSSNEIDIRAAVLSISQSEDTSFVPILLTLDFSKFGNEVIFALAQIGSCNHSIRFLWDYLKSSQSSNHIPSIFFAIGKIGKHNDLQKLIEFYNSYDSPVFPYEGISRAILQFQIRGIVSKDAKAVLETEVTNPLSSKERVALALFVLARYRDNDLKADKVVDLFRTAYSEKDEEFLQYLLMSINEKNGKKISESDILNSLDYASPLTKIQLIKVVHLIGTKPAFTDDKKIRLYLKLLYDFNENVAIQSAISLKNLKPFINQSSKSLLKEKIDSLLFNSNKSDGLRGELFLSRFDLFENYEEHQMLLSKIDLSYKYIIPFYSRNIERKDAREKLLQLYLDSSSVLCKIKALEEIVSVRNKLMDSINYTQTILSALNSKISAPLISIAAEGVDSSFVANYRLKLKNIISHQIEKFKDDPTFFEAMVSLINLAKKIGENFYSEMIEISRHSKLYSLRKYVANKIGDYQAGNKELDKFENIWSDAFKYKRAIINTSKGSIIIQFNSDIAPISVGNFCMLAKQNFYNGIFFHRVVPGFVIQAGDSTATGWSGPGYDIISEFSDTNFDIGYVGMASAGKDTESSQFFIMQGFYPHLDARYTLFGKVISGMSAIFNINEEDKILSIELN